MPTVPVNGIDLNYQASGHGPLVVLVMGTGAPGSVWHSHQVPALVAAGFRVVTYDHRGTSGLPDGTEHSRPEMSLQQLVDDLAAIIEHFGGPAHLVGTSLGALVAQELTLARPDLVQRVVAMTGFCRVDPVSRLYTLGQRDLFDSRVQLPARYSAAVEAMHNLSPATLRDEAKARDWLDILELTASPITAGERAQLEASLELDDRRADYRSITNPMLVIGFADDQMVPTYLSQELSQAVPSARYVEVADSGHYGYLEQPAEVNRLIIEFLS